MKKGSNKRKKFAIESKESEKIESSLLSLSEESEGIEDKMKRMIMERSHLHNNKVDKNQKLLEEYRTRKQLEKIAEEQRARERETKAYIEEQKRIKRENQKKSITKLIDILTYRLNVKKVKSFFLLEKLYLYAKYQNRQKILSVLFLLKMFFQKRRFAIFSLFPGYKKQISIEKENLPQRRTSHRYSYKEGLRLIKRISENKLIRRDTETNLIDLEEKKELMKYRKFHVKRKGTLVREEMPREVDLQEGEVQEEEEEEDDLPEDYPKEEAVATKLLEYDKFYKEQFFKNEIFKMGEKLKDKEEDEIQRELEKDKLKLLIKNTEKTKESNKGKGLDVTDIEKELAELKEEYKKIKKKQAQKVELQMNNTDSLLFKGKLLYNYFNENKNIVMPKFTVENDRDKKGKEIIDFKPLLKDEKIRRYYDKCCCLKCRKSVFSFFVYARFYCNMIVDNLFFENFSLLVIIINTIFILISDPRDNSSIANDSDQFFLYFYTVEAILKILAFGFVSEERAYLRDYWNILDFFVVLMGWVSFIIEHQMHGKKISGLAGLRAFRILRPLKTVKAIKGLKRLVIALLGSISRLSDTSIVLVAFFLLFAIGGVQMWQGVLMRRCMSLNYGFMVSLTGSEGMCTFDTDCTEYSEPGNKFVCVKGYKNPDKGIITFDNTLTAFITVFVIATLEGWTDIFVYVSKTFKDKIYINPIIIFFYFHVFIFIGSFYLINLFLAVTNTEFLNIGRMRKELTSKRSFYQLIKSKYDLKERDKQEKKKKERELKLKNKRKTDDSLTELKYKIEEEAYHIEKRPEDIPFNYTTIKDIYIMQNNNPEELYQIDKIITQEERYLCDDIKKQVRNINQMIKERNSMQKNGTLNDNSTMRFENNNFDTEELESESRKKKQQSQMFTNPSPKQKLYPSAIESAITSTQKYIRQELLNLMNNVGRIKRKATVANSLKAKIEKKEQEKVIMNQISIKENLPYEDLNQGRDKDEEKKKLKKESTKKLEKLKQEQALLATKHPIKEIYQKKKFNKKIDDELSFMTDLSLSNNDTFDGRDNSKRISKLINMSGTPQHDEDEKSNLIDLSNDTNFIPKENSNSSIESLISEDSILVEKKTLINEEEKLYSNLSFPRPKAILPELMKLKNDVEVKEKLEKMRKHFNVNEYLQKAGNRGYQVASIGRRRSFIKFLQFTQEKDNLNELYKGVQTERSNESNSLDKMSISLFQHDDDISSVTNTFSEASFLPQELPTGNEVYDENMNIDEMAKKIELNKYTAFARSSFLDRRSRKNAVNLNSEQQKIFFNQVNKRMNENIVIDAKKPRGRNVDNLNVSHIFLKDDREFEQEQFNIKQKHKESVHQKNKEKNLRLKKGLSIKEEEVKIENDNEIENIYFYKSKSIPKNCYKYPIKDSINQIVEETNKINKEVLLPSQEVIPSNFRSRKYYMNYLYNIKEKDVQVKDTFKMDQWRGDIFGKEKKIIKRKKLPESIEAVFVFNDKKLNLKKYKYIYNKDYEYFDDECAWLTNDLCLLPIEILEIMPPRMRNFGRYACGKDIDLGVLPSRSLFSRSNSQSQTKLGTQSSLGLNSISRSKSTLTLASAYGSQHKVQDEIRYKRGFYEKIFKKIDEFNYRTLSHYFLDEKTLCYKLTDEKRREDKKKEEEEHVKAKENSLEVKGQIKAIKIFDINTNSSRYNQWSGNDVLYNKDLEENRKRFNDMISTLEDFGVVLWNRAPGVKQFQKIRYALYLLSINQYFDFFIMALVIANAIIMALDGNLFTPEKFSDISISNYVFNSIFIAEFVIKLIGLGPIVYFSDAFTYLDVVIIAFAILDMVTPSDNASDTIGANKSLSSQLSFLRVFRIFRVLRLTKILRKMKSMRLIIVSIKKSLADVAYIILILIMFLLIFQLLGMSLFNGNMRYQSFLIAFYATFQVLTTENWNGVFYEIFPLSPFTFFYYVIWIFLGNYILFNLFISILLQSFDHTDEQDEDDEDDDEKIENMFTLPEYFQQLKEIEKEHKNRLKKGRLHRNLVRTKGMKSSMSNSSSHMRQSLSMLSVSQSNISSSSLDNETTEDVGDEEDDTDRAGMTEVDKNIHEWKKINNLFRRNECEIALYFISQTNPFRIICMKLISNKKFDTIILIMILLSTARLILDTLISGYTSVLVFDITDIVFNIIFMIEMILKVVALGFVMDEGTYLRDNWNKIDLIIVIVSLFDFQTLSTKYFTDNENSGSSSFNFLKVLRLLRTLRPLRFISHNVQLKLIITSLFDSILPIVNALFIVLIVFFMFSIVGMNLFYNLYHNCFVIGTDTPFKLADSSFSSHLVNYHIGNNMREIEGFCINRYNGVMDTGPAFKFSNIFVSLVTSYVLGSMEGWPDIMNSYRIFSDYYGIFFVIYLLVVSYFFLNLFTGIMFKYFNDAWSKEKKVAEGDKKAEKYYDFLQQIELSEPDYKTYQTPDEGTIRYYLVWFAKSKILDNFIMIIIFLNLITMAMNYDGTEHVYQNVLDKLNLSFTSIFIAECVLKIISLGPMLYFYYGWNRFDFFVVVASIADLITANIDGITASFLKSFQIIRVLRVLRITRVLRLVKSLKSLEKLIQTLRWSVSALANVFILMFLIFCIFAILGCYLYEGISLNEYEDKFNYLNQYYNFDNFYFSFLLCFRCATGEDWPSIMMEIAYIDPSKVSDAQAYIYMILMNFITAVIMLNLFTMVTLQQYDEFTNKSYNPVELFESFINEFKMAWNKYSSEEDNGFRMKRILVPNFFVDFNWKKLNFPELNKLEQIKKYISNLDLRCDPENFVYFHDVLLKVVICQMGSKIDRTQLSNAIITKEEKKIADAIKKKINHYMERHEINKKKLKNPFSTFNPLTSQFYFKVSYTYLRAFIGFYRENAEIQEGNSGSMSMSVLIENEGSDNDNKSELSPSNSSGENVKEIVIEEGVHPLTLKENKTDSPSAEKENDLLIEK